MNLSFRRITPADSEALLRLIALAEAADEDLNNLPQTVQAELAIGDLGLAQQGWLAQAQTGEVVGYNYVEVIAEEKRANFWLRGVVAPAWRGRGIGRELLRRSWADMESQRAAYQKRPAYVNAWSYQDSTDRCRLFARFGLQPYHIYHELTIPAAQVGPAPPLPPELIIRPWSNDYCERAAALRNQAFAESWGYQPTTPSALRRCFNTGRYEPDYSFTAWHQIGNDERMVGVVHACLAWTRKLRQANEAEIVWIAVDPKAQRQRIGEALILAAMEALRRAGVETISVSADNPADNPAIGLYLRLGFTIRKAVVDYRGEI